MGVVLVMVYPLWPESYYLGKTAGADCTKTVVHRQAWRTLRTSLAD